MTIPNYNHMKPLRDAIEAEGIEYYNHAFDHMLDEVAEYEYGKIYFTGVRFKFIFSEVHPPTVTLRRLREVLEHFNYVIIPVGVLGKR